MFVRRCAFVFALLGFAACTRESAPVATAVSPLAVTLTTLPPYDADGCYGPDCASVGLDNAFEYVIVGAGAGGGPLAARLARAGHRVLLLEAGSDAGDRLTYQIPAWHVLASEDAAMRWDYFVQHYDDPTQAARDDKLVRDGAGNPEGI